MRLSLHTRLAFVALGLGGCQLVTGLSGLETDPTGAGGSTSSSGGAASSSSGVTSASSDATTGAAMTTSSAGGAGGTMATSSASTDVASSSSTGMPPLDLQPCGNTTDTFATLDTTKWAFVGASVNGSGQLLLTPPGNGAAATADIKNTDLFDDCFTTVKLPSQDGSTTAAISVVDTGTPATEFDRIAYEKNTASIVVNGMSTGVTVQPAALGIALHGGFVYFFYSSGNGWTFVKKVDRPSWMGGAQDDTLELRCASNQGKKCAMDDFNVMPIQLADLP